MATNRYPDAPESKKGTTVETGNWFQDFARDILEKHWGISPKAYSSAEYQLTKGEGRFCEFKHDPHTEYEHLSIEVSERAQANGRWAPGGIFATPCPFYIQGDKNEIWVFPTHMLVKWAEMQGIRWENFELTDENKITQEQFSTMRRFFLDYKDAARIGGIRIKVEEDDETNS